MTTFPTANIDFSHVFQTKFADISQRIHIFQYYSSGITTEIMKFQTIPQGFKHPVLVLKCDGLQIIFPLSENCMVGVVVSNTFHIQLLQ